MLLGHAALRALEDRLDDPEQTRPSAGQNAFPVSADGAVNGASEQGMVSTNSSPLLMFVHWILQFPLRRIAVNTKNYHDYEVRERQISKRLSRQFTHDTIRQVLTISFIQEHVNFKKPNDCNLGIGDGYVYGYGYGVLTSLFLLATPNWYRTVPD